VIDACSNEPSRQVHRKWPEHNDRKHFLIFENHSHFILAIDPVAIRRAKLNGNSVSMVEFGQQQ
jgi:hypothetical protein